MRQRSRTTTAALLLAAACALLAGCGGNGMSKADYEQRVGTINGDLQEEFASFREGRPTKAQLEKAAGLIDDAADDLDELDPPSDVEEVHDRFVKVVRSLGDSLRALAPAVDLSSKDAAKLSKADQDALVKAQTESQQAIEELGKVQEQFEKDGYDITLGEGGGSDAGK